MAHLTIEERNIIENCLNHWDEGQMSFKVIGEKIMKDPTTISKEIKLHKNLY